MKKKYILPSLVVALASFSAAQALEANLGTGVTVDTKVKTSTTDSKSNAGASASLNASATSSMRGNSTSSANSNNGGAQASTTANVHGIATSSEHMSAVATYVKSLLMVADRQGGIGAEVRVVARAQNDAATTTATAMTKVEQRGSFRMFLLGPDYKNLGVIRSELSTTTASITKLRVLLEHATTDADKAEISTQITAMENEQAKVEAYIKSKEGTFSLFGWLAKLFS